MSATAFDTLKAAEDLAGAMRHAVSENVATGADIARLEAQIAGLETRMVKFGAGLAIAVVAALFGLLRLFGGAG